MASSKPKARLWPFALNWLRRQTRPEDGNLQRFTEYIAGIGMIQVNENRKKYGLPLFKYATILTGIHESNSDEFPHATIAAATDEMQKKNKHIVVHSRVSLAEMAETEYIGSEAFVQNIRDDNTLLRLSYQNPVAVRTSLIPQVPGRVPVSHTADDGGLAWYIYDDVKKEPYYLDPSVFYRSGEGPNEEICFWNELQGTISCATFLGTERPATRSPDPEPTNLEAAVSKLHLGPAEGSERIMEWVKPILKLDDKKSKPVQFQTKQGKIRTGWERWEAKEDSSGLVFQCVGTTSGIEYWAESLPGVWVKPRWKTSSRSPVQFEYKGNAIKTDESKWVRGINGTFFAYIDQGTAYLATDLSSG